MRRLVGWSVLLAVALVIKFLFVDRYFPEASGNMLIWLPIAAVLCAVMVGAVAAYTLLTRLYRKD